MNLTDKKIVLAAPVTTQSGYGHRSRDIAKSLINMGANLDIVPIPWGNTPQDALKPEDPDHAQILERLIAGQLTYKPDIFIHITIPNEFQVVGNINIGITAGIETTICKPEWIQGCNRMDLVLTSSEHSKRVFETTGYEQRSKDTNKVMSNLKLQKPVKVLFEGLDTKVFNNDKKIKKSDISTRLTKIPESFCFLSVGHWLQGDLGADRKDIGAQLKLFYEVFSVPNTTNSPKQPAFVIKTSSAGYSIISHNAIESKIQSIRALVQKAYPDRILPNVYLLHGDLTDAEMNDLYNSPKIKAMVSFTKGEGFGRPLLEFSATGKPVICSNWSGPVDFLHPEYATMLPGMLTPVHASAVNEWIIADSKWFTVNYEVAAKVMIDCMNNYKDHKSRSKAQKAHVIDNFTLEKMQKQLQEYLENMENFLTLNTAPEEVSLQLPKRKMKKVQ